MSPVIEPEASSGASADSSTEAVPKSGSFLSKLSTRQKVIAAAFVAVVVIASGATIGGLVANGNSTLNNAKAGYAKAITAQKHAQSDASRNALSRDITYGHTVETSFGKLVKTSAPWVAPQYAASKVTQTQLVALQKQLAAALDKKVDPFTAPSIGSQPQTLAQYRAQTTVAIEATAKAKAANKPVIAKLTAILKAEANIRDKVGLWGQGLSTESKTVEAKNSSATAASLASFSTATKTLEKAPQDMALDKLLNRITAYFASSLAIQQEQASAVAAATQAGTVVTPTPMPTTKVVTKVVAGKKVQVRVTVPAPAPVKVAPKPAPAPVKVAPAPAPAPVKVAPKPAPAPAPVSPEEILTMINNSNYKPGCADGGTVNTGTMSGGGYDTENLSGYGFPYSYSITRVSYLQENWRSYRCA